MDIKKIKAEFKAKLKKYIFKNLNSYIIENFNESILDSSTIHILGTRETLKIVQMAINEETPGAYMRFGDGDVYLLKGSKDAYQSYDKYLAHEMLEAFQLSSNNIHKCLAIHSHKYGFDEGMVDGNHLVSNEQANYLLKNTFKYFIGEKIYSPVALHHTITSDFDLALNFLKILKLKSSVFIGNESNNESILNSLFGNFKWIKTPSRNAYSDIDRIFFEACEFLENNEKFSVVVIAMGCSGRPLMKRLVKKNFNSYYFDFGSLLDGFNGNISRTWLKLNDIDFHKIKDSLN